MHIKLVRKPRSGTELNKLLFSEVRQALSDLGAWGVGQLEENVVDWDHKPEFKSKATSTKNKYTLTISYDATTPEGENYRRVDEGTGENAGHGERYPITAVNAPMLSFWVPTPIKTLPPGGGPTYIGPEMHIFTKQVMHPGIRPRLFSKQLSDTLSGRKPAVTSFNRVIDAALRSGRKKIGKQ